MRIRDCNFNIGNETNRVALAVSNRQESVFDSHERKRRRANGGCLGYPEAKKDAVSCENVRGVANRH